MQNLPSTGSFLISILGHNLGLASYSVHTASYSPSEASEWMSDSSVVCKPAASISQSRFTFITVSQILGSSTFAFSVDTSQFSSLLVTNVVSTGCTLLTVMAANYGTSSYSAKYSGMTTAEASCWLSDSAIQVAASQGHESSRSAVVTTGFQFCTATNMFSIDNNVVYGIIVSNRFSNVDEAMVLKGSAFPMRDNTIKISIHSSCESSEWLSTSSVLCRITFTHGQTMKFAISSIQVSTFTEAYSFDYPMVSFSSLFNFPSTGSVILSAWGSLLRDVSSKLRIGHTSAESSLWISETSMSCQVTQGSGKTSGACISVVHASGSLTELLTFENTFVSTLSTANFFQKVNRTFVVVGESFMPYSLSPMLTIGSSSSEATSWISDTAIACRGTMFTSRTATVVATASLNTGTLSSAFSSDSCSVALQDRNGPRTGSAIVHIENIQAKLSSSGMLRIKSTSCEQTLWNSESSIICQSVSGAGHTQSIMFSLHQSVSSTCSSFSFDIQQMTALSTFNIGTLMLRSAYIFGKNFGSFLETSQVEFGQTICESTIWVSETTTVCKISRGLSSSRLAAISVGQTVSTTSSLLSYDSSQFLPSTSSNIPTTGSTKIKVGTAYLVTSGISMKIRVGESSCEGTDWKSDSSITCHSSSGALHTMKILFTLSCNLFDTMTEALTYDENSLTTLCLHNVPSTGAVAISFTGLNYGVGESASIRPGFTACEFSSWVSSTSVLANPAQTFAGTHRAIFTCASRVGTLTSVFSTTIPTISTTTFANSHSTGSIQVFISGDSFNQFETTSYMKISPTACEATLWISQTQLCCLSASGKIATTRIVVSMVNLISSGTEGVTMDAERITLASKQNFPGTGAVLLSVYGSDFSRKSSSISIRLSETICEATGWLSDTSLICLSSHTSLKSMRLQITVDVMLSTLSESISVDDMSLSLPTRQNCPVTGSVSLTILGSNFELKALSAVSNIGNTPLEGTDWISDTAIVTHSHYSVHCSMRLMLSISESLGTLSETLTIDGPRMNFTRSNAAATGTVKIPVLGYLSAEFETPGFRISPSACESTKWESVSSVMCYTASNAGGSRQITITTGLKPNSLTELFTSDHCVSIVYERNLPSTGSSSLTVHGLSFLSSSISNSLRISFSASESSSWSSDTSMQCLQTGLALSSMAVVISSQHLSSSCTEAVSIDRDALSSTKGSNLAITGSTFLSISGSNLGHYSTSIMTRIAHSTAEMSEWRSTSSIACLGSITLGMSHKISITASIVYSTVSTLLSTDLISISDATGRNYFKSDSAVIQIFSAAIGLKSSSQSSNIQYTACDNSEWISDTALRCLAGSSKSPSMSVIVTHSTSVSTATAVLSSDTLQVSAMQSNSPCTGSRSVVIFGNGMGLAQNTIKGRGQHTAFESSEWFSETSIHAMLYETILSSRTIAITTSARLESITQILSSDTSFLSTATQSNSPNTGSTQITVFGTGSGNSHYSISNRLHSSSCEGSDWLSSTSIVCFTSSSTARTRQSVFTVGNKIGSLTDAISHDSLLLLNDANANTPSTGAVSVTILGGLAPFDASPGLRTGFTAMEASDWTSDTSIAGFSSRNTAGSKQIVLTSHSLHSITFAASADVALLSDMGRKNYASPTETTLTIRGTALGSLSITLSSVIGVTVSEMTIWNSETTIISKFSMLHSASHKIGLTFSPLISTTTYLLSADSPSSISTVTQNLPGTGNLKITILGVNLGLNDISPSFSTGSMTSCESSLWISCTSLHVRTAALQGRSLRTSVTMGCLIGKTGTNALTIDHPEISGVIRANSPSSGSVSMTIHGLNFGLLSSSPQLFIGTSAETSVWLSDTSITSRTSCFLSTSLKMQVTIAQCCGSSSMAFSTDTTTISNLIKSNSMLTGTISVSILGSGFSPFSITSFSRMIYTSSENTEWESDSSVRCMTSSGVQSTGMIIVTLSENAGSLSSSFSYSIRSASQTHVANFATTGSSVVTLFGNQLLRVSPTTTIRISGTGSEYTTWDSEFSLTCSPSQSWKSSASVLVTSHAAVGSLTQVLSIDILSVVLPTSGNKVSSGSISLTLHGSGFGAASTSQAIAIGFLSAFDATMWISDTSVLCQGMSTIMRTLKVEVTIGQKPGTSTEICSTDLPLASASSSGNVVSTGSASLTVSGLGFANVRSSLNNRIISSIAEASNWLSETALACRVGRSLARSGTATITNGALSGSLTSIYSTDLSSLSNAMRKNVPQSGSASFTIQGTGFASFSVTPFPQVGSTVAESSSWIGDSSIHCRVARILQKTRSLQVTANLCQVGTSSSSFSIDMPIISTTIRTNTPASGSSIFTITGGTFIFPCSHGVRLNPTASESSEWIALTSISGRTSTTARHSISLAITAGDFAQTISSLFSTDLPYISSSNVTNGAGTGSYFFTIFGMGYSVTFHSPKSRSSRTTCEHSEWQSETSIKCLIAIMNQRTSKSIVTIALKISTQSECFSFNLVSLSTRKRSNAVSSGSTSVTLFGTSFSSSLLSISMRIHHSASQATKWNADTALTCSTPTAILNSRLVQVSAALSVGSSSQFHSFDIPKTSSLVAVNGPAYSFSTFLHQVEYRLSTARGKVGMTPCESTGWKSFTSIMCQMPKGFHASLSAIVSIGQGGVVSHSKPFSYDSTALSFILRRNVASTGSSLYTVFGSHFLAQSTVKAGTGTTSTERTRWLSLFSVQVMSCAVLAGTRRLSLSVGLQVSTRTESMSTEHARISSIKNSNSPSAIQLRLVSISGASFGGMSSSLGARISRTSCEKAQWISDSSITGLTVTKIASHSLSNLVTVFQLAGSMSNSFSSDVILQSITTSTNMILTGSIQISIFGYSILNLTPKSRVGGTQCELTRWLSSTLLVCRGASGLAGSQPLLLTSSNLARTLTQALSFNLCVISEKKKANLPNTGHMYITLTGSNIGVNDGTIRGRLMSTNFERSVWIADTRIMSKTSMCSGHSLKVGVTARQKVGTTTQFFSSDCGVINSIYPANSHSTGGNTIQISGAKYGSFAQTAVSRMGETKAICTNWVSDTSVICRTKGGKAFTEELKITVVQLVGTITSVQSFDQPSIVYMQLSNSFTTSITPMSVSGSSFTSFELSFTSRLGHSGAMRTNWVSSTSVKSFSTGSVGGTHHVSISLLSVGTTSEAFSTDRPSLISFNVTKGDDFYSLEFPGNSLYDRAQLGSFNGFPKTQFTIEFWMRKNQETSMQAVLSCRSYTGFTNELVIWATPENRLVAQIKSEMSLLSYCEFTPDQWNHFAFTWDSVGGQVVCIRNGVIQSEASGIATGRTLDEAIVMMIGQDQSEGRSELNAFSGGISQLRIWDLIRALPDIAYSMDKTFDFTIYSPQGLVACYTFMKYYTGDDKSPFRNDLVIVGNAETFLLVNAPVGLTLYHSEQSFMVPCNAPSVGLPGIYMQGKVFGLASYSVSGRVDGRTAAISTLWYSDSSVRVHQGYATRSSRPSLMTVGKQCGTISQSFTIDSPESSSALPQNLPSTSSISVTISGNGYGAVDYSILGRMMSTTLELTKWLSDTVILAKSVSGSKRSCIPSLTVASSMGSLSGAFTFDGIVVINEIHPRTNLLTSGDSVVYVKMKVGYFSRSYSSRIGASDAEKTVWISNTCINSKVPRGMGHSLAVAITSDTTIGSVTDILTFDTQLIDHQNNSIGNLGKFDHLQVTLSGVSMGYTDYSLSSRLSSTSSERSLWYSGNSRLSGIYFILTSYFRYFLIFQGSWAQFSN
eukprot:210360-Hanusia_phi.AAC.1